MNPGTVPAGHRDRHCFVILALDDADAGPRAKLADVEEFEKPRIFFIDAQYFVRMADLSCGKAYRTMLPYELRHAAEERHSVRAAAFAPEALEEQAGHLRRNPMLEALRLFVRARPFETNYIGEKLFGQAMA